MDWQNSLLFISKMNIPVFTKKKTLKTIQFKSLVIECLLH